MDMGLQSHFSQVQEESSPTFGPIVETPVPLIANARHLFVVAVVTAAVSPNCPSASIAIHENNIVVKTASKTVQTGASKRLLANGHCSSQLLVRLPSRRNCPLASNVASTCALDLMSPTLLQHESDIDFASKSMLSYLLPSTLDNPGKAIDITNLRASSANDTRGNP
jgi:hypothetical protein